MLSLYLDQYKMTIDNKQYSMMFNLNLDVPNCQFFGVKRPFNHKIVRYWGGPE